MSFYSDLWLVVKEWLVRIAIFVAASLTVYFGARLGGYLRSTLPFERVWTLSKVPEIYLITGNLLKPRTTDTDEHYQRRDSAALMASGDIRAFGEILGTLKIRYKKIPLRHYFADVFPEDNYKDNIVSIGGPKFNVVTRTLLSEVDWKVRFEDSILVDEEFPNSPLRLRADAAEGVDYGFAMKAPNPESPEGRIMIIAGCSTFGVLAASRWVSMLENEHNLRKLASRFAPIHLPFAFGTLLPLRERYFVVMVKAKRRGNDVSNPEVLRLYVGVRAKKSSKIVRRLGCFAMDQHGDLKLQEGYPVSK